MRKFIYLLALLPFTAIAQVKTEKISLEEAMQKAKTENKLIMMIASATW